MPGYVKLWTTLLSNEAYLSLPGRCRGMYHQLILWCKAQRDDGLITASGWTEVGATLGYDRRTVKQICDKLATTLLLTYDINGQGVITIVLANYKKWQGLTVKEVAKNARVGVQKWAPLRPDQTRPDQTNKKSISKDILSLKRLECPFEDIRDLYLEHCTELSKVYPSDTWPDSRKKRVAARWKEEPSFPWWTELFKKVHQSDFLCGRKDDSTWKADFDWIMKPANMQKIKEDVYVNRTGQKHRKPDYGETRVEK